MARTVEEILKQQLGNLLAEVAVLSSAVEQLREENAKLKEEAQEGQQSAKVAKQPEEVAARGPRQAR